MIKIKRVTGECAREVTVLGWYYLNSGHNLVSCNHKKLTLVVRTTIYKKRGEILTDRQGAD